MRLTGHPHSVVWPSRVTRAVCVVVCCLFRLSEAALEALAHRNDEEEADSGRRSKRAKACADPVAIKTARMRQGLLVLMVRTPAHNLGRMHWAP